MADNSLDAFKHETVSRMETLLDQISFQERERDRSLAAAITADRQAQSLRALLDQYSEAYETVFGEPAELAVSDTAYRVYGTLTVSGNVEITSLSGFDRLVGRYDSGYKYEWKIANGFTTTK